MADPAPASAPARQILLWPAHREEMGEIARQLEHFGLRARLCPELPQAIDLSGAAGLLVDCDAIARLPPAAQQVFTTLARQAPMAGLCSSGEIEPRLAAVRLGCQAFFTRPLDMTSLLDTLERLTAPPQAEAGRVLIVDDSPALVAFYSAALTQAGFVCHGVTDPLLTLEALVDHAPELILLDMHMPGASGEELARVIRQQDAYLSIPIVFLSAESDLDRQRQAMSLGGDEFLQKPIQPEHLISAVKSRIIRYRALRALMVRDSLTGLLNHTSFKERLRAEVARARRQARPLCVALIDIDHFKKVNDTYGHPAGDRVIKNLARLLKQRLRGADVIGRYGGEEFALALPDTALDAARITLDNIRARFEAIEHLAGERGFHVTLSAGLAACQADSDGEQLIQHADEALYAAKHGGRNRVVAHPAAA